MSETPKPQPSSKRKGIRKFGFTLSLLLVVTGTLGNIIQIFSITQERLPSNMIPWFLSTMILCVAIIIGLLALLAED